MADKVAPMTPAEYSGYRCAKRGFLAGDNPYAHMTELWRLWKAGWVHGLKELQEQEEEEDDHA